jgi:GT2 family glycosyltransferase
MSALTDILVLHYNRADLTAQCIAGCLTVGEEWRHLWVVDNGSDDPLPDHPSERVTVLRSAENRGFSGGLNFGMAHVQAGPANSVLLLNNDAVLMAGYIRGLAEFGMARQEVWACCGTGFQSQEDIGRKASEMPTALSREVPYLIQWEDSDEVPPTEPKSVDWATGAALWLKRTAWERVGPWEESFFLYWEDVDYGWRVRAAGGEVWYVPDAHFLHIGSASSPNRHAQIQYYYYRNHLKFWARHDRSKLPAILRWHLQPSLRRQRPAWVNQVRWFALRDWLMGRMGPISARVDKKLSEGAGRE